jgi:hypothetical protein
MHSASSIRGQGARKQIVNRGTLFLHVGCRCAVHQMGTDFSCSSSLLLGEVSCVSTKVVCMIIAPDYFLPLDDVFCLFPVKLYACLIIARD